MLTALYLLPTYNISMGFTGFTTTLNSITFNKLFLRNHKIATNHQTIDCQKCVVRSSQLPVIRQSIFEIVTFKDLISLHKT